MLVSYTDKSLALAHTVFLAARWTTKYKNIQVFFVNSVSVVPFQAFY